MVDSCKWKDNGMALRRSDHSLNIGRNEGKWEGREWQERNKEDRMRKIKEEPNLEENQRNKKFLASSSCYRRP